MDCWEGSSTKSTFWCKPDELSSIPGLHVKVEGGNCLLISIHVLKDIHTETHTPHTPYTHTSKNFMVERDRGKYLYTYGCMLTQCEYYLNEPGKKRVKRRKEKKTPASFLGGEHIWAEASYSSRGPGFPGKTPTHVKSTLKNKFKKF